MGGPRRASRLLVRVNRPLLASVLLTGNTICRYNQPTRNYCCLAQNDWKPAVQRNRLGRLSDKKRRRPLSTETGNCRPSSRARRVEERRGRRRDPASDVRFAFFFSILCLIRIHRTGLPLSTYFSTIKLRWMIDHIPEVSEAHESDQLLFGTVESWLFYVSLQASIVLYY